MLRLILCAVIVAASLFIGCFMSSRIRRRIRLLNDFLILFNSASLRIAYTGDNLASVFSENFAGFVFAPDEPFTEQWESMVGQYGDILNVDDKELLIRFTEGLGESDVESQQKHIGLYASLLRERLDSAQAETDKKAKVYRAVPFFIGLAAAILLI